MKHSMKILIILLFYTSMSYSYVEEAKEDLSENEIKEFIENKISADNKTKIVEIKGTKTLGYEHKDIYVKLGPLRYICKIRSF